MELKTYNVSLKSDYLNRYSNVSPIKGIDIIGQSKWKKSDTKWKILPTL